MCLISEGFKYLDGESGIAYKLVERLPKRKTRRSMLMDTIWRLNKKMTSKSTEIEYVIGLGYLGYESFFHLYRTKEIAEANIIKWHALGTITELLEVQYEGAIAQDCDQIVAKTVTPLRVLYSFVYEENPEEKQFN